MATKGSRDETANASALDSEKNATSTGSPPTNLAAPATASVSASMPKLRSCVICRRRKVKCDKNSPCSNCRRANIACTFPSNDRPPRWARRLERITNDAALSTTATPQQATHVMERLRNLEGLVKELSGQLEQANAAATSVNGRSVGHSPRTAAVSHDRGSERGSKSPPITNVGIQEGFGRMVLKDANRSRYVSSGFWSRVDDELHGLKMDLEGHDYESSEDESPLENTPSTQELDRTPSERHAFLFGHNIGISAPNSRDFHPFPSQVPFLFECYSSNVNFFVQIVHMPTVTKMMRGVRGGDMSSLTPANEALLFAIYYAAVTSMEDDDVMNNFGTTKGELNLKYRLGLEYALAKADFLNTPNIVLVQAFIIFLSLLGRHDSPRFVWMMVGLVIRMAQSLGLHRDGSHFPHLNPYAVEIRRRAWWTICMLDVRASEDQGTEYTIPIGSFDTKIPLNINDADIGPEMKEAPTEQQAMTDLTFAVDVFKICDVSRRMMSPGSKENVPSLQEQIRLVNELYTTIEEGYLRHSVEDSNIVSWVGITCVRLTMSKMTLMIYLPVLSTSTNDAYSADIRDKLLVSAIEVAEYNHALNAEPTCRHWRWMFQTYTHWHAVVLLLMEVARRPLSPLVERAWIALHSSWLVPAQPNMDKKLQLWIPLRKLTARTRKHREAELQRLRGDVQAIEQSEQADRNIPVPASPSPFSSEEGFREHWRNLVDAAVGAKSGVQPESSEEGGVQKQYQQPVQSYGQQGTYHIPSTNSFYRTSSRYQSVGQQTSYNTTSNEMPTGAMQTQFDAMYGQTGSSSTPQFQTSLPGGQQISVNSMPWIWADVDPMSDVFADIDVNMDLDNDLDWLNWLETAKNMELNQDGVI